MQLNFNHAIAYSRIGGVGRVAFASVNKHSETSPTVGDALPGPVQCDASRGAAYQTPAG